MKQRPAAVFVGDHLAMDFLNSIAMPTGVSTEWLADGADLVDWLEQAGVLEPAVATRFRKGPARELNGIAGQARVLREWWRRFLHKHADGSLDDDALAELAPLNKLLALEDSCSRIVGTHGQGLMLQRANRWEQPEQLLQPAASAIADLVCHEDLRLVRTCEGPACTLMFLDRTKAHARRWCSMAACGNRAKAAAHRARNLSVPI